MIKAVGFDLDQTLYPKSPEIDDAIQRYIYERIADHKMCTAEEGKRLFLAHYPAVSGRQALVNLGLPHAADVVQEALERADISKFLKPDEQVIALLNSVRERFAHVALITGSHERNAKEKLAKLGISLSVFDCLIFGDAFSKRDGAAFREWLARLQRRDPAIQPAQCLYVGDRPMSDVEPVQALGMQAVLVNVKKQDPALNVPQFASLREAQSYLLG